jgi:hypothetical protein
VKDWGIVICGRVIMTLLNGNILVSCFKLLPLLINPSHVAATASDDAYASGIPYYQSKKVTIKGKKKNK